MSFIAGWFAAAPLAWPYISRGFDDGGNAAKGVFIFLVIVFAAGVLFGAVGLFLGGAVGMAWERIHRSRRSPSSERVDDIPVSQQRPGANAVVRASAASTLDLRYEASVNAAGYVALLALTSTEPIDEARMGAALARTINIAAWHGDTLVGIVRVLTDGLLYAAVADIIVHPDFRMRGVGRELMNRAYEATPRGTLYVNARNGSTAFFERLGCERGTPGFVMRRKAR